MRQLLPGTLAEDSTQIGALQIGSPINCGTVQTKDFDTQKCNRRAELFSIQLVMNSISRPRMGELKLELGSGGQAAARAP